MLPSSELISGLPLPSSQRRRRNERALREDTLGSIAMAVLWLAVAGKKWNSGEHGAPPLLCLPACARFAVALVAV